MYTYLITYYFVHCFWMILAVACMVSCVWECCLRSVLSACLKENEIQFRSPRHNLKNEQVKIRFFCANFFEIHKKTLDRLKRPLVKNFIFFANRNSSKNMQL